MKNIISSIVISALSVISSNSYADCDSGNLLINGSFEKGSLLPSTWETIPGGDSNSITGWTTEGAGVEWFKFTAETGSMPNGTYAIDLNNHYSTNGGGIQQTFATEVGNKYLVKFYASTYKKHGRTGQSKLEIKIGDEHYIYNLNNAGSTLDWTYFNFTFRATSTSTTLKLSTDTNSLQSFTFVDDVSVIKLDGPKAILIN